MDTTKSRARAVWSAVNIGSLLLVAACTEPTIDGALHGIGDAGVADASSDAGAGLDPSPSGFAVVSSDYAVSSIGLLDADGEVLRRELVHSGSASTGLATALSGDVALPTRSGERGVLTLLDRFRTDVVTRIDLASGAILGQLRTHAATNEDAYSSNPRDFVWVDATTAWVARYEPYLSAEDGAVVSGIDLIDLDPTHFELGTQRVDFSPWSEVVERVNVDTGARQPVTAFARPGGMVRRGDYLIVGLELLSRAFDAAGRGLVALVDLRSASVAQVLELPGLKSCGDIVPVPDDETRVAVACTGFYRAQARDSAGIAMLVLEDERLRVEHAWHAVDDVDSALTMYGLAALSATEVLATAAGDLDEARAAQTGAERVDVLYAIDLASGEQREVLRATGAYVIGSPEYDPRSGLVLVPDASADAQGKPTAGIRLLRRGADGSLDELGVTVLDAFLPVRQVRAFY